MKEKIKIILGDLRHSTIGKHSAFMPIALGYIGSYAKAKLGDDQLELHIETDPNKMLDIVGKIKPDIVALSNYIWNCEVNQIIFQKSKRLNPKTICIAGGPEFPTDYNECLDFLSLYPNSDFYVYREGEIAFAKLVEKIIEEADLIKMKSTPQIGVMSINPASNKLTVGPSSDRLMDLDDIPSPYLTGMMDKFFDGDFMPFIESGRGCPYQCAYCDAGASWYSKMACFSVERIKAETEYIARKMKTFPYMPFAIADSNFGMLKRDEQIAEHIGFLQKKYGWPKLFIASTGKSQIERIIRVSQKMNRKLTISLSVQSMNEKTLDIIKRKNLADKSFHKTVNRLQNLGIKTYSDLITPLPGETKESFFDGFRKLSMSNIQKLVPFTTMMLKGTELAAKETRKKHEMKTKFRILPREFGEYDNQKCFEIEEVCISTNTMPFSDYLECRGFSYIAKLFSITEFDFIDQHLPELGIDKFDLFFYVWKKIHSGWSSVANLYKGFIQEANSELFESSEEAKLFYGKEENYKGLLRGEIGDNLMQKYIAGCLIDHCYDAINGIYECLEEMANKHGDPNITESLTCAKKWMLATRDLGPIFRSDSNISFKKYLELEYDVDSWRQFNSNSKSLVSYKRKMHYQFSLDNDAGKKAIESGKRQFGDDIYFWVPKMLETTPVNIFWFNCQEQNMR